MNSAFLALKKVLDGYHILPDKSWQQYMACCSVKEVNKGETVYKIGQTPNSFCFIYQGLMRAYILDGEGNEYNKNFFAEGRFPGAMTSLLTQEASWIGIQALEDCVLVEIDFGLYRQLLFSDPEMMAFHIKYLETHWLIEKEPKEVAFLQHDAKQRYETFLHDFCDIKARIPLYHVASYLGVTPTQLSRVRKNIQSSQHM